MKPVIFFLLILAPLFLIGCDSGSGSSDDDKSSLNSGSNQTPPTLAETKIIKMYASSSECGARSPDSANDDDITSMWGSMFYEDDEESPIWIYADLGSNHYVKKVILHLGIYANDDAFPSGFEFQYSLDGLNWELVPGQKYAGFERTSSTSTGNSKETFDFYTVVKARFIKLICYVCGWSHGHTPQTRWMNIQEFDIYHMENWDEKYNKYEITDAVQKYYFYSEGRHFHGNFDRFTNYYATGQVDASKGRFNSLREICNNSTSKPLNTVGYPFISLDKSFEIRDLKHTANFDFEKPIYSKDEILISDSINELLAGNLKKSLQNAGVQSKGPTWYSFSNIDGSLNSNNCVLGSSTQTHGIIGHFGSSDNNWIKSTLTSMHTSNGCNNWSDLLCISEKK